MKHELCFGTSLSLRGSDADARYRRARQVGFTLVELLVVIGIVGMLIALLMPALGKARQAAKGAMCLSNLRQSGVGLMMYAVDNDHRVTMFRIENVTGLGEQWYPWSAFIAGEFRPGASDGDHFSPLMSLPAKAYVTHGVTRCPVIPGGTGYYTRGSYWCYGSYYVGEDTSRYNARRWNFRINEASGYPSSGKPQSWGRTRSTEIFALNRIPQRSNFILLADAIPPANNGQIYAMHLFTPQPAAYQNSTYFVHNNRLAALMADAHAEMLSPGDAFRAPNGITRAFDKNHVWRGLPW